MITGLIIGGLFLGGVSLYAYFLNGQSKDELASRSATQVHLDTQLNGLVGALHTMNDQLKARMARKPASFDDAMSEAMKDNHN